MRAGKASPAGGVVDAGLVGVMLELLKAASRGYPLHSHGSVVAGVPAFVVVEGFVGVKIMLRRDAVAKAAGARVGEVVERGDSQGAGRGCRSEVGEANLVRARES